MENVAINHLLPCVLCNFIPILWCGPSWEFLLVLGERFMFLSSFSHTALLPSHHHIFLLHFSSLAWFKGCKNNQVACSFTFVVVVLKTISLFLFFNVRYHLCAPKVYIRGKKYAILVLYVVYKQLKRSFCSWIRVWLTARLLRWSYWHNQNMWLVGGSKAAGALDACTGRLLLGSSACLGSNLATE